MPCETDALERVLDELTAIDGSPYPQKGQYKEMYLAVSHSLRRHLGREFGVDTRAHPREMTNALRSLPLGQDIPRRLLTLFTESDLVKFAQVTPTPRTQTPCWLRHANSPWQSQMRMPQTSHAAARRPHKPIRSGGGGDVVDGYSFRFAAPWLLALIPALALFLRGTHADGAGTMATMRYSDVRPIAVGGRSLRMLLRPLLPTLRVVTLAVLIVALARPQWVQAREVVHGEGVDVALTLDISGSMASLDFEPNNRLDAAKAVDVQLH